MARLKKGSAAAKKWGAKMKRLRSSKNKKSYSYKRKSLIKSKKRTMAKRRYKPKRKTSKKRGTSIFGINTMKALSAMLYGGIRSRTSNLIAPYTARIPLGNVADEAGMLAVATIGKKFLFKKAGIVRDALTAGQTIELARLGEAASKGQLGLGRLFGGSPAASTNGYVFN